jgi:hypothetical protein
MSMLVNTVEQQEQEQQEKLSSKRVVHFMLPRLDAPNAGNVVHADYKLRVCTNCDGPPKARPSLSALATGEFKYVARFRTTTQSATTSRGSIPLTLRASLR